MPRRDYSLILPPADDSPSFAFAGPEIHLNPKTIPHRPMNAALLARALKVVPDNQLLINIVRLRVRQLIRGHRPLVAAAPGVGYCDVALLEIAEKKLTSEANPIAVPEAAASAVINFPNGASEKKAA